MFNRAKYINEWFVKCAKFETKMQGENCETTSIVAEKK